MKESIIQTLFGKVINIPGVYELKLCKGNALPYNAVKDHQVEALLKAKHDGLFHKITDQPIFTGMKTRFNRPKPFDCVFIKDYPAYVAICFYKPRERKLVYLIDIDKFITAKYHDTRKSMLENTARVFASKVIEV